MAVEERETTTEEEVAPALSVSAAMGLAKNALEEVVVRLVGEVSEVNDKPGYKAVYFTVKDEKRLASVHDVDEPLPGLGRGAFRRRPGGAHRALLAVRGQGAHELRRVLGVVGRRRTAAAAGGQLGAGARGHGTDGSGPQASFARLSRGHRARHLAARRRRPRRAANPAQALSCWPASCSPAFPWRAPGAADGLVDGLAKVVFAGAEVVLLVRGGGSFEDLMPFNDRRLARTIAACPVPVVTGIGHEPDTSIADMVADVRASTPTAAAEAVAPAQGEIAARIQGLGAAMGHAESRRLDALSIKMERVASLPLFREPTRLFDGEALALDDLSDRLGRALPEALREDRHRLGLIGEALGRMLPGLLSAPRGAVGAAAGRLGYLGEHFGERSRQQLDGARGRLMRAGAAMTDPYRASVAVSAARLHDLSPLAIIGRGYAMAKGEDGRVVSSVDGVAAGERLVVTLSDGELDCTVNDVRRIHSAVEAWG